MIATLLAALVALAGADLILLPNWSPRAVASPNGHTATPCDNNDTCYPPGGVKKK